MTFQEKLREIDRLQELIQQYGKLPEAVLQKVTYKFRLEWNYYSNRMEGNTLTLEETKQVMAHNIDVQGKPLKDVKEMTGHDNVIVDILMSGKGELNLSERRIKEFHTAIKYEESPSERHKIGKWKKDTNYLYNYNGERVDFVSPGDVPEAIHELVNWVNAEIEKIKAGKKSALHPAELAFQFHARYIAIHPFYDGNGRTARILSNLILIRHGFPPIYIKEKNDEKGAYYRFLANVQSYGANPELLYSLFADYLIRSLQIIVDAIEGKDIDEKARPDQIAYCFKLAVVSVSNTSGRTATVLPLICSI